MAQKMPRCNAGTLGGNGAKPSAIEAKPMMMDPGNSETTCFFSKDWENRKNFRDINHMKPKNGHLPHDMEANFIFLLDSKLARFLGETGCFLNIKEKQIILQFFKACI